MNVNSELLWDIFYDRRVLLSLLMGTAIGLEREIRGKDPSLRTFAFISMGSCIFGMLSIGITGLPNGDPSRIAAQIVSGIGFLGAGAIFRSQRGVSGLTTAAMMWVAAAIGLAIGFDKVQLGVIGTFYVLAASFILNFVHEVIRYFRHDPPVKPRPHREEEV